MVKFSVHDHAGQLRVEIEGYEGPRLPLLEAFGEWRSGRSRGAAQVELDWLEADEKNGRIELDLTPPKGSALDAEEVARRVEDTLARFTDPQRA